MHVNDDDDNNDEPRAACPPAKAFMVVPPKAEAAKPVEAVTKVVSLGRACRMCFNSRDLPVPAHPVKKTLLPDL